MFDTIQKMNRLLYVALAVSGITAGLVFGLTWFVAPEVGGNFWPYIRFGVSALFAFVAGKIALLVSGQALSYYFIEDVMSKGNDGELWSDEDVDKFTSSLEDDFFNDE